MSKTTKDRYHRNDDRKYADGYKQRNTSFNKEEKMLKNLFRSSAIDVESLVEVHESILNTPQKN
jgi:hypothetical protein